LIDVSAYSAAHAEEWDELVDQAPMATFLHSRRYLGYHEHRFTDKSLLLRDSRRRVVGLLPAAVDPGEANRVVSHPGVTYGGLLHTGALGGGAAIDAVSAIRDHYGREGFRSLRYKAVPHVYHRRPSADDIYALTQLGGRLVRCDLSCAIDLADRGRLSERRRRGARKAREQGVDVRIDDDALAEFWNVLEENLATRHSVRPTHTVDDIRTLVGLFPDAIELVVARLAGVVVAGLVLFCTSRVVHAQYIASTEEGRRASALDVAVEHCIGLAASTGARFFDFGISTESDGRVLNRGLHAFKSEFGGGGVIHTFHDLDLTGAASSL
jgi:CelD/BcsL family acetyltransferase involved in cellulose biosynthesis